MIRLATSPRQGLPNSHQCQALGDVPKREQKLLEAGVGIQLFHYPVAFVRTVMLPSRTWVPAQRLANSLRWFCQVVRFAFLLYFACGMVWF